MNRQTFYKEGQGLEVADIFREYGEEYRKNMSLASNESKVMRCIEICRTAKLGGHIEECDTCGFRRNAYNSCRDRHCPKCQTVVKERWINDRKAELLPCGYFHNVFTLPHRLNPIIRCNKTTCLSILFDSVKETLQAFAVDPQWRLVGTLGFIAVLHTWNQKLLDHFHIHCVIPAGVLSSDKRSWKPAKRNFLFRTDSLAKNFKNRYLHKLYEANSKNLLSLPSNLDNIEETIAQVAQQNWVVYSKVPFAGPEQVLEYLGRYTHRVAISNSRIKSIAGGEVTFTYRDRVNGNREEVLTIPATEFIRRFMLHVLPKRFMKIRYFGFLSHRNKKEIIPLLRSLIAPGIEMPSKVTESIPEMMQRLTGKDIGCCPSCQKGQMVIIEDIPKPLYDTS